jgi:hypothetical protein
LKVSLPPSLAVSNGVTEGQSICLILRSPVAQKRVNFPEEMVTFSVRESMPTELIGEFGTPGATSEWIDAEGKLAITHLKKIYAGLRLKWN